MNIYYIDYENVSSQGLKGVEALTEDDEVVLLYSKKADNVKIDILSTLMSSKAKIQFLPVHVGTPNALDFQLVTLLFLNYRKEDHCYIISKDSGYDCCIKTAAQNGAPNVARYPNIESAVNGTTVKKTRRGKRSVQETDPDPIDVPAADNGSRPSSGLSTDKQQTVSSPESSPAAEDGSKKKPARRHGRKKAVLSEADSAQSSIQPVSENTPPKASAAGKTSEAELNPEQTQNPDQAQKTDQPQNNSQAQKPDQPQNNSQAQKPDQPQHNGQVQKPEQPQNNGQAQKPEQPQKQEQVLQQRYLSKQFEPKVQPTAAGSKPESDRPVSILSVIRRRNDVQLDMHQTDLIRDALKNSSNKQQFYNYFVKKLGQKQGIELYHSIKSSYTDLVNSNLL